MKKNLFRLRISPWIRSPNRNGAKCSVRNLCRTDFCENPRKSASLPCPFNTWIMFCFHFPMLWAHVKLVIVSHMHTIILTFIYLFISMTSWKGITLRKCQLITHNVVGSQMRFADPIFFAICGLKTFPSPQRKYILFLLTNTAYTGNFLVKIWTK